MGRHDLEYPDYEGEKVDPSYDKGTVTGDILQISIARSGIKSSVPADSVLGHAKTWRPLLIIIHDVPNKALWRENKRVWRISDLLVKSLVRDFQLIWTSTKKRLVAMIRKIIFRDPRYVREAKHIFINKSEDVPDTIEAAEKLAENIEFLSGTSS